MLYQESSGKMHPFTMTSQEREADTQQVKEQITKNPGDVRLRRRLAMLEIADNYTKRILDFVPEDYPYSDSVELSNAMIQALEKRRVCYQERFLLTKEYLEENHKEDKGFGDIAYMAEINDALPPEEETENFRTFLKAFYGEDEEQRTKCLSLYYDRMDSIDPLALDLSCIEKKVVVSQDTELTECEKDLLKLFDLFSNSHTYTQKGMVENPDFWVERYSSPKAAALCELKQTLFQEGFLYYLANGLLAYNNLDQNFQRSFEAREMMAHSSVQHIYEVIRKLKPKAAALEGIEYHPVIELKLSMENAMLLEQHPPKQDEDGTFSKETGKVLLHIYCDITSCKENDIQQIELREMLQLSPLEVVFIDGVSFGEKYKKQVQDNINQEEENRIRQDATADILTGNHRIDYAIIQIDKSGEYEVTMAAVHIDLHEMDVLESGKMQRQKNESLFVRSGFIKKKTAADRMDKNFKKDTDRMLRHKKEAGYLKELIKTRNVEHFF